MPGLSREILQQLDRAYGPVVLDFALTEVPDGDAPQDIKEQWLGVPLPVRESNIGQTAIRYFDMLGKKMVDNDEPVGIAGFEAVQALTDACRIGAADFWRPYQVGLFTFRAFEGEFQALDQQSPDNLI